MTFVSLVLYQVIVLILYFYLFFSFVEDNVSCETIVDLCLIIDSSGSIRDNSPPDGSDNWTTQLNFLSNLIGDFVIGPKKTRVAAVVFSEEVRLVFPLNRYENVDDIRNAIENIPYLGQTTNTPEALLQSRMQCFSPQNGDRPAIINLAITVTDGVPYPPSRRGPAIEAAKALRDSGVKMIAVGVTDVIDQDFLRELSSTPQIEGLNYFTATDFKALEEIRQNVVDRSCEALEIGM